MNAQRVEEIELCTDLTPKKLETPQKMAEQTHHVEQADHGEPSCPSFTFLTVRPLRRRSRRSTRPASDAEAFRCTSTYKQPPTTFVQITKNLSVSTLFPGPTKSSHQPFLPPVSCATPLPPLAT